MRMKCVQVVIVSAALLAGCTDEATGAAKAPEGLKFVAGQGSAEQLDDTERGVAELAIEALAKDLSVPAGKILIDTIRAVQWSDSSIGCPQPGEAYMQVVTPGHKVTLRVDGQIYVVHEAGNRAFVCRQTKAVGGVTPKLELVFGKQMVAARKDLAARLGVPERDIRPASAEEKTWDDAGLGCPEPGLSYAAGPVKGWALKLKHHSRDFIYHTDLSRTIPCPAITAE